MKTMYGILVGIFVLTTSIAWSTDTSSRRTVPHKDNSHVGMNPGIPDDREGGETIEDAFLINVLPFLSETGNTCDNVNDYDEVCPYSGSTSPDVVYSFTPARRMSVHLDLCSDGNQYDTKVYVYEDTWTPGFPHACNDDFCSNIWTPYASRLERVPLFAGNTYYIVIDGYGEDCGNYQLFMEEAPPPVPVECDPDHVPEGEPPMPDGYDDDYNSGCGGHPGIIFQDINWIDGSDCAHLCGVSGWYFMATGLYRDTDWFEVTAAGFQIDVAVNSEHITQFLISAPNPTCATVTWPIVKLVYAYTPMAWFFATSPGETYWIWVGPGEWVDLPDFIYTLEVCGIQHVVPTKTVTWGGVKALYGQE